VWRLKALYANRLTPNTILARKIYREKIRGLFQASQIFVIKLRVYPSGAPYTMGKDRFHDLATNIELVGKNLSRTNIVAK